MNKTTVLERGQAGSEAKDSWRELDPKKDGPDSILSVRDRTLKVSIGKIHIVVLISRVTLSRTHQEAKAVTAVTQAEQNDGKDYLKIRLELDDKHNYYLQKYAIKILVADRHKGIVTQYRGRQYGYMNGGRYL